MSCSGPRSAPLRWRLKRVLNAPRHVFYEGSDPHTEMRLTAGGVDPVRSCCELHTDGLAGVP